MCREGAGVLGASSSLNRALGAGNDCSAERGIVFLAKAGLRTRSLDSSCEQAVLGSVPPGPLVEGGPFRRRHRSETSGQDDIAGLCSRPLPPSLNQHSAVVHK